MRHVQVSSHRGINWDKSTGKWLVRAPVKGKQKFIGRFDSENDAAQALLHNEMMARAIEIVESRDVILSTADVDDPHSVAPVTESMRTAASVSLDQNSSVMLAPDRVTETLRCTDTFHQDRADADKLSGSSAQLCHSRKLTCQGTSLQDDTSIKPKSPLSSGSSQQSDAQLSYGVLPSRPTLLPPPALQEVIAIPASPASSQTGSIQLSAVGHHSVTSKSMSKPTIAMAVRSCAQDLH